MLSSLCSTRRVLTCTVVAEPARPVDVYRTLRQHAAAAEDTLLVYFAGHGKTGRRNELFLCLPDTDPDELPYSAWPYDELRRVVADSRATKRVGHPRLLFQRA